MNIIKMYLKWIKKVSAITVTFYCQSNIGRQIKEKISRKLWQFKYKYSNNFTRHENLEQINNIFLY